MGPRAFKEGKYISPWVEYSGLSILAGCVTSVSLTRALLYDILDDMHRSCSPITLRTWVDDCFQPHTGPKAFVLEHAFGAAQRFAKLMADKGLKISSKSTITASSQDIADDLQCRLAICGLALKAEASAKDLGVDFAGGGRRRIPVQQLRLLGAQRVGRIVSQLGKATKQAKRLVITGVRPRFYGFAAMARPRQLLLKCELFWATLPGSGSQGVVLPQHSSWLAWSTKIPASASLLKPSWNSLLRMLAQV